jgi:hypothetical protein
MASCVTSTVWFTCAVNFTCTAVCSLNRMAQECCSECGQYFVPPMELYMFVGELLLTIASAARTIDGIRKTKNRTETSSATESWR